MTKRISWCFNVVLLLLLLTAIAACDESIKSIMDSEPPPATFREIDLVGTWEGHYGYPWGTDRLILREDGTFKQIYGDEEGYVYETPWNKWWAERFPDGRVRVHLEGARWYLDGNDFAELDGLLPAGIGGPPDSPTYDFYDPFARHTDDWRVYFVEMVGKLVLNVRRVSSGELILVHMSGSTDPPTWTKLVRVSTIETPSPLQTSTP